ncbi:hypothetical protein IFM89_034456 [Coptis chinensis]|uniref:Disease resistance protein winged helix domain-containing protein n=1 Tax=Coptis chinensis TaxID=261450 RepID=A0A835J232_9MAGN|nr:hypothetical protein IFM89_034456 [Coptis chinensis]
MEGKWFFHLSDGAMARLRHLRMSLSDELSKLPDGLRSITNLQIVEIADQTGRFKQRVKENGEDWDKIEHVPFIVVLDSFSLPDFLIDGAAKDYEINVHKLISLWIAEGFVQSRRDEKIQDVAEDYLEDYIQRSMLQLALKLFGCYF